MKPSRRFTISAGASVAALAAAGLSIWAWGPHPAPDAVVSPITPAQAHVLAKKSGSTVVTGGPIQSPPKVAVAGNKAPRFSLPAVEGASGGTSGGTSSTTAGTGGASDSSVSGTVSLDGVTRPTVVDFMANWCTECHAAEPVVESVYQAFGSEVDFVGVDSGDSAATAAQFVKTEGVTFPVALDANQTIAQSYGVDGMPEMFFVEPGGHIERHTYGPLPPAVLAGDVAQLISASR